MVKKYLIYLNLSLLVLVFNVTSDAQHVSSGEERIIKIETSLGDILISLYNETPLHRDNMLKLIDERFYDNQLFHRVMKDFMIQGGDPHSVNAEKGQRLGTGGPGYQLPAEFNEQLFHKKGALAAAREGDRANPEKQSSGSQFYIVHGQLFTPQELKIMVQRGIRGSFSAEETEIYTTIGGTPHLDGAYTVFGEVIQGLDILDKLAAVPTDANNRPIPDVVFSITLVK